MFAFIVSSAFILQVISRVLTIPFYLFLTRVYPSMGKVIDEFLNFRNDNVRSDYIL